MCKVQYELQYSLCTATPSPHTKPTLFEGRERLYTGYMRYNQMETALWGREGGRIEDHGFTRYNFVSVIFRASVLFALPLIGRIFLSKGKCPDKNFSSNIFKAKFTKCSRSKHLTYIGA